MDKLKQLLKNDIVERTLKTFVQTFLATLAVGVVAVNDFDGAVALVVAAVSASISAAWNTVRNRK